MTDECYVCANGHEFPAGVLVDCAECGAAVACIPMAAATREYDELVRYRAALEAIAGEESGVWGTIARRALRGPTT